MKDGRGGGSEVQALDGGRQDGDGGVGEPGVDAGEGQPRHAHELRLLHLRRICREGGRDKRR